ncbi:MAG: hypothetical protein OXC80_14750, partial [Gammaproteobacteria bacterium]|nr:hypothetical protein [Gammaproteobacteria bacterium]
PQGCHYLLQCNHWIHLVPSRLVDLDFDISNVHFCIAVNHACTTLVPTASDRTTLHIDSNSPAYSLFEAQTPLMLDFARSN